MPDFIPKTITALGGAKGIIALLVFLGINGGWFAYSNELDEYSKKVENQVTELAGLMSNVPRETKTKACNCEKLILEYDIRHKEAAH